MCFGEKLVLMQARHHNKDNFGRSRFEILICSLRLILVVIFCIAGIQIRAELPAEPIGKVEKLPVPYPKHWIIVHDLAFLQMPAGKMIVMDPTKDRLNEQYKGLFDAAFISAFTQSKTRPEMYVGEHFYSRVVRGKRTNVLTIYDKENLSPIDEIILTGGKRAEMAPSKFLMHLSRDERLLFIYNFSPATSVTVVDILNRKIVNEVHTPVCALVYPTGERGFSSLCTNASMISYQFDKNGKVTGNSLIEPFFNIEEDALLERPAIIGGIGYFPTIRGNLQEINFKGSKAKLGTRWSLASIKEKEQDWRPGGMNSTAVDTLGNFYVLMHEGGHEGTHKDAGSEVWMFNAKQKKRIHRITLKRPAISIEVTGDETPQLIATNDNMNLDVYDSLTGEHQRTLADFGQEVPAIIFAVE